MARLDSGMQAWRQMSNHNRMIEFQQKLTAETSCTAEGEVEIAFFGSSAFRIRTPLGLTLMVDPWRNYPTEKWDWYFNDFPDVSVDIGVSSHAHFDHDALTRLDAHVLLDRLIGTYQFADLKITGIAEKHATDSSAALYDFKKIIWDFGGIDITPPHNPRSWEGWVSLNRSAFGTIFSLGDDLGTERAEH